MTPAEHVIRKLGGIRKAAALIGVPPSTVQSWKESGFVPARRQGQVLDAAGAANIPLKAEEFISAPATADSATQPAQASA